MNRNTQNLIPGCLIRATSQTVRAISHGSTRKTHAMTVKKMNHIPHSYSPIAPACKASLLVGTALAALLTVSSARAQQGFNSGGLNTCSIINNQNLLPTSTCYGYINGTPTFFTQQPAGGTKPLNFDNFSGQTGHSPAPIAISPTGVVTIAGGGALGPLINITIGGSGDIYQYGTIFTTPAKTFAGPVTAPVPLFTQQGTIQGTIGNGGATQADRFVSNAYVLNDFVVNNYSSTESGWRWTDVMHSITGGRNMANMTFNQAGPITPDVNTFTGNQIPPSFTELAIWSAWNNTAGGTVDPITHKVKTLGLLYGTNQQMLLKSVGTSAAQYYTLANLYGEGDIAVQGPTRQLVLSGTVTVGDTETIHITSSVNPGFGSVDLVYTNVSGDTLGLITQKLGNLVLQNSTLALNDIGMSSFGASDTLNPTVLNFYWPDVLASHTTDVSISISQNIGCTETLTLGAPVIGASVASRYGGSTLILRSNSASGYGKDTWWGIGKQGSGGAATSGEFHHLFLFGGLGNDPDNVDPTINNIEPALPPFTSDADLFVYIKPNSYGSSQDAPTPNLQLHSVFDYRNVNFTGITKNGAPGGPLLFPGYELYGDGSQQIGGAAVLAKHGAGAVGLAITASGTVATSATLVAGGGGSSTLDFQHRYYVGETEAGPYGDMWRVDSIGTLGDVVTFSAVCDGATEQHCTYASVPAGITPAATATLDAGSGAGWIIGYVWASATSIVLGDTGQTTQFKSALTVTGGVVMTAATCGGTGVVNGFGNDFSVQIGGTSSATCTITPATTFTSKPVCTVGAEQLASGPVAITPAVGSIVITAATASTNGIFDVHCLPTS